MVMTVWVYLLSLFLLISLYNKKISNQILWNIVLVISSFKNIIISVAYAGYLSIKKTKKNFRFNLLKTNFAHNFSFSLVFYLV